MDGGGVATRHDGTVAAQLRQPPRALRLRVAYGLSYVFAAPQNRSQQLGLVLSRRFGGRRFGLTAPSLGCRVGYYLSDPSRRGQLAAAAGLTAGIRR